jgi:hypothetical protein
MTLSLIAQLVNLSGRAVEKFVNDSLGYHSFVAIGESLDMDYSGVFVQVVSGGGAAVSFGSAVVLLVF